LCISRLLFGSEGIFFSSFLFERDGGSECECVRVAWDLLFFPSFAGCTTSAHGIVKGLMDGGCESTSDWLKLIVVPILFFSFPREACLPCFHEFRFLCDSCIRFSLLFGFGLNVLPRGKKYHPARWKGGYFYLFWCFLRFAIFLQRGSGG